MDYYKYLESLNGFYLYRWGDHALRTLAVGFFLEEKDVMKMNVPYGHQGFCQCVSGDARCMRERDYYGEVDVSTGNKLRDRPGYYRENWLVCVRPDEEEEEVDEDDSEDEGSGEGEGGGAEGEGVVSDWVEKMCCDGIAARSSFIQRVLKACKSPPTARRKTQTAWRGR